MDATPTHQALGLPSDSDADSALSSGRTPPTPDRAPVPLALSERIDDALARLDDLRSRPATVAVALVAVALLCGAAWWFGRAADPRPVEDLIPQVALQTTTPPATTPPSLLVHISGAVRSPGVYELDASARVLDAINAAGGPLDESDLHQLNLAAPLTDGIQIRVPLPGEIVAAPSAGADQTVGPIDVNRASASDLETLSGVGPATAAAIVEWRERNGPFLTVDDLLDVPGIGPAKLAGLEEQVVVR